MSSNELNFIEYCPNCGCTEYCDRTWMDEFAACYPKNWYCIKCGTLRYYEGWDPNEKENVWNRE